MSELNDRLFEEILQARQRVYAVGKPTPLQKLNLRGIDAPVYVKREDLGPIKAYKWRGAYNCMASLPADKLAKGVVAASAGNHAQGVALAARVLNCKARIYMPRSTPEVKQVEVKRHGGDHVEIVLHGDSYDETASAAHQYAEKHGCSFIHPYDDIKTMGGQGTLADEVVMSGHGPFDRAYVQIGGGGLAAAVACGLKKFWPDIKIIAVEGIDQASMKASVEQGGRTTLSYVDVFCDGTAVRIPGEETFEICKELVDEYVTVTNNEVCHSIRAMWEANRVVPEPSGAMGLAGFLKQWDEGLVRPDEKSLVIISGANMDFTHLAQIARQAGIGNYETHYLRIPMAAKKGQLLKYLRNMPESTTLVDMQYGKTAGDIQYPVFGVSVSDEDLDLIRKRLQDKDIGFEDISADDDVNFRIIHYQTELFDNPLFVKIEFPERCGALLDFMERIVDIASVCYFNYAYSGERVGRALVGLEFDSPDMREACMDRIGKMPRNVIRAVHNVSETAKERIMGNENPIHFKGH
ncbi:pyridoxal-phosphate dependent enzyme [Akkermansia sp. N21116]|jgi:threonine dehydratase|uniref:pyridoxal-phosphate dependent enzyme n=1 Tax=Akkermansia sp. N21116 TaxID=3040764 RepID=UPI00244EF99A|nr:pyridoxal-phosphate dependent enzyme [Akkermansia sp. N21116]WPX40560.1 pyridoxal-phosphate dependent enzyme [Akkermansia sp. N21116]